MRPGTAIVMQHIDISVRSMDHVKQVSRGLAVMLSQGIHFVGHSISFPGETCSAPIGERTSRVGYAFLWTANIFESPYAEHLRLGLEQEDPFPRRRQRLRSQALS